MVPGYGGVLEMHRSDGLSATVNTALGWNNFRTGNSDVDRKFEIVTTDQNFAQIFVNPAVVDYILAQGRSIDRVSMLGNQIFTCRYEGTYRDPDNLVRYLDMCCDIVDRVPETAWSGAARQY